MRKVKPKEGAVRIIKKFLLFPKTLPWADVGGARLVTRWLETAEIKQKYSRIYGEYYMDWVDISWADMVWATVEAMEFETGWEE